jgi:hypothetical protein
VELKLASTPEAAGVLIWPDPVFTDSAVAQL